MMMMMTIIIITVIIIIGTALIIKLRLSFSGNDVYASPEATSLFCPLGPG